MVPKECGFNQSETVYRLHVVHVCFNDTTGGSTRDVQGAGVLILPAIR